MAVNQVFRASIEGSLPVQGQWANVFHFRQLEAVGPGVIDDMTALAGVIEANIVPAYLNWMASTVTIERITVRTIAVPPQGVEVALSEVGGNTGDALPPQICALIVWKTLLLGRRYSGKTFLPPTTESAWANTGWTTTALTSLEGVADAIVELKTNTSDAWESVVHSKTYALTNPITSYRVIRDARTQRRRSVGFGS